MKRLTRIILPAVLVAGAALLAWAFWPKPIDVDVAKAVKGAFVSTVEQDCRTRIRNRYAVSAPAAGKLLRPTVEAGDQVADGQAIAVILPASSALLDARSRAEQEQRIGAAEAALAAAEADVERMRAAAAQADADRDRVRMLADKGVATTREREQRELAAVAADRQLQAAEMQQHVALHQLDAARAVLAASADGSTPDRIAVTAPVGGVILRVAQESEGPVTTGAPLFEIGDPADMEVACDILTTDAARIAPGAPVAIDRWGGPTVLAGVVQRIEPSGFTKVSALGVEEQRVWAIIDITSPREEWKSLGDAFRVDARIEAGRIDDAILLPAGSLFRRGDGWSVFVVDSNVARERTVTVLGRSGATAAIGDGVAEGDRVVTFPPSNLADGASVAAASE
jgi:HlyD family secretion protein